MWLATVATVVGTLAHLGCRAAGKGCGGRQLPRGQEPDRSLHVGGRPVLVALKETATVTPHQAERLVASVTGEALEGCARVVVADRVVTAAREILRAAGLGMARTAPPPADSGAGRARRHVGWAADRARADGRR
jgi:hypothetical protein